MAEKRILPNFEKYQYAALAAELAKSKADSRHIPSALEVLLSEKGLGLPEDAKGLVDAVRSAYERGEQIATIESINNYNQKFEEKRGQYKPAELLGWYDSVFSGVDGAIKKKVADEMGKYDETYSSIMKKFIKAEHDLDGASKGISYSPEQIDAARKVKDKYTKIVTVLETLDRYKFESLRGTVVDTTRKHDLKKLAAAL